MGLPSRRSAGEWTNGARCSRRLACSTRGAVVDWTRQFPGGGRTVVLPTYPWQRERFWHETKARRVEARAASRELCGVVWRQRAVTVSPLSAGPWLVLGDWSGTGEALQQELRGQGARCIRAVIAEHTCELEPGLWTLAPHDSAGYRRLLHDAFSEESPCSGVIDLRALDVPPADTLESDQVPRAAARGRALPRAGAPRPAPPTAPVARHVRRDGPWWRRARALAPAGAAVGLWAVGAGGAS